MTIIAEKHMTPIAEKPVALYTNFESHNVNSYTKKLKYIYIYTCIYINFNQLVIITIRNVDDFMRFAIKIESRHYIIPLILKLYILERFFYFFWIFHFLIESSEILKHVHF